MNSTSYLFNDPANIYDFYFVTMRYAKDALSLYAKFFTKLDFKIYSIAYVDDIIVVIVNSEYELQVILKILNRNFNHINVCTISGNGYSLEICIDEAKSCSKLYVYDRTNEELAEGRTIYHESVKVPETKIASPIKQVIPVDDRESVRWSKKKNAIINSTYETFAPIQRFISMFHGSNEQVISYMIEFVLSEILRKHSREIYTCYCDLLTWKIALIDYIWERVIELQTDDLINRFYVFRSSENATLAQRLSCLSKTYMFFQRKRWGDTFLYHSALTNPEYRSALNYFVSCEYIDFIDTGRVDFKVFEYSENKGKKIDRIFIDVSVQNLRPSTLSNNVHSVIAKYIRDEDNMNAIARTHYKILLLHAGMLDYRSSFGNIPRDVSKYIMHLVLFR